MHCDYPDGLGRARHRASTARPAEVCRVRRGRAAVPGGGVLRAAAGHRPAERALIWKGRKSAFAAVGRISPDYIVQDGVIPARRCRRCSGRSTSRRLVRRPGRQRLPRRRRQPAPAGALRRVPAREGEAAEEVSGAILDLCIRHGGSSPASTGSAPTRRSTCRGCSPTRTSTPCSWSASRSDPAGTPTPARSSRRPACAARSRAAARRAPAQAAGLAEA